MNSLPSLATTISRCNDSSPCSHDCAKLFPDLNPQRRKLPPFIECYPEAVRNFALSRADLKKVDYVCRWCNCRQLGRLHDEDIRDHGRERDFRYCPWRSLAGAPVRLSMFLSPCARACGDSHIRKAKGKAW